MPTNDVENIKSTKNGRDLQLSNKLRIVAWRKRDEAKDPEAQLNYFT